MNRVCLIVHDLRPPADPAAAALTPTGGRWPARWVASRPRRSCCTPDRRPPRRAPPCATPPATPVRPTTPRRISAAVHRAHHARRAGAPHRLAGGARAGRVRCFRRLVPRDAAHAAARRRRPPRGSALTGLPDRSRPGRAGRAAPPAGRSIPDRRPQHIAGDFSTPSRRRCRPRGGRQRAGARLAALRRLDAGRKCRGGAARPGERRRFDRAFCRSLFTGEAPHESRVNSLLQQAGDGGTLPRVSVGVPFYEQPALLGDALALLAAQSLPPHEVIVVDDGSQSAESHRGFCRAGAVSRGPAGNSYGRITPAPPPRANRAPARPPATPCFSATPTTVSARDGGHARPGAGPDRRRCRGVRVSDLPRPGRSAARRSRLCVRAARSVPRTRLIENVLADTNTLVRREVVSRARRLPRTPHRRRLAVFPAIHPPPLPPRSRAGRALRLSPWRRSAGRAARANWPAPRAWSRRCWLRPIPRGAPLAARRRPGARSPARPPGKRGRGSARPGPARRATGPPRPAPGPLKRRRSPAGANGKSCCKRPSGA